MYYKEMTEELTRILAVLKRSAGQIQQQYKATILGVFGSYVRGEQTHDSDLDLLVRFHVGLGNFLEARAARREGGSRLRTRRCDRSERAADTGPEGPDTAGSGAGIVSSLTAPLLMY